MVSPMLTIRLARVGKRGHATFRVVVTEHTRPAKSGSLEQLGSYDPHTNKLSVDPERVKMRIAHGAKASPTVHNLLIAHKVIEGEKVRAWKPKRQKKEEGSMEKVTTAPTATTPTPSSAGDGKPPTGGAAPQAEAPRTPTPGVGVDESPTPT